MPPARNRPELRLARIPDIHFHERAERGRTARLTDRLRRERLLRNPPIVASLGSERWVLLDGANRVSACRDLGYSHMPVQVVDYDDPAIQLKGWHHLLLERESLDLRATYGRIPGVRLAKVSTEQLATLLGARQAFAVLVDVQHVCWGLFPETGSKPDVHAWIDVLHQVVDAYEGKSKLERIKWADDAALLPVYQTVEHQICLFPTLSKPELLQLAHAGTMIPTGITRHLVPGRALGLNLDLDFLTQLESDAEQRQHFEAFVHRLEVEGRIRYYEESVFILNE
jgi:hypothetical protein